jgi:hypothetical protein
MSASTPAEPAPRAVVLALALAAILAAALHGRADRGEDFMGYYCSGRAASAGLSPYEPGPYQDCLWDVRGRPNLDSSRGAGSAEAPAALPLFRALAALPYPAARALWNAALLAASLALVAALRAAPMDALLLALWPGFAYCWSYHKLALLLFAAAWPALTLVESGREEAGGAALGLLALQPQWLAAVGLCLAARKRRRALAAAAAVAAALLFLGGRGGWLAAWFANAAARAGDFVGYDNQGLFYALYRPLLARGFFFRQAWMPRAARGMLSLALAALAWSRARRADGLAPALALLLLALPDTHASDAIWAFPLLLSLRDRAAERRAWDARAAAAAALGAVALVWALVAFGPGGGDLVAVESRKGCIACAALLVWLAAGRLPKARAGAAA